MDKEFDMSTKGNPLLTATRRMLGGVLFAAAALTPLLAHAATPAYQAVTTERLINAQQDSGWLMYRRNYESTGYAPFDQINTSNVAKLKIAFDYQSGLNQGNQVVPIPGNRVGPIRGNSALDSR
jgi:alcohol dehydrogenase (cytochrome c)